MLVIQSCWSETAESIALAIFFLLQAAEKKLYSSSSLWSNFGEAALDEVIAAFQKHERPFGRTEPYSDNCKEVN